LLKIMWYQSPFPFDLSSLPYPRKI